MAKWTREERTIELAIANGTLTLTDIAKTVAKFPETPTYAEVDRDYDDEGERRWTLSWSRLMTSDEEEAEFARRAAEQARIDEEEAEDRKAGF